VAADQDEMESELELLKLKRLGLTVLDMRRRRHAQMIKAI
jgi:hypothetical protein